MVRYLKLDEDFWDNPKVILAGQDGGTLYLEILALNNRAGRDGQLTEQESSPRIVGRRLVGNFGWTADRLAAAWKACIDARLVAISDGRIVLVGWDDSWRTAVTGDARTRAWRERRAASSGSIPAAPQRDDSNVTHVTETPSRRDKVQRHPIPSIPFQKDGTDIPFARAHAGEAASASPDGMTEAPPSRNGSDGLEGRKAAMVDSLKLERAIAAAGVFDRSAGKRRDIVRNLVRLGVTVEAFEALISRARKQGDNPAALLAHWLTSDDPAVLRGAMRDAGFGLQVAGT